jgi:spermidine/putrescine transport system ATP-binding protein
VRPEKIDLHLYPAETTINTFEGRLTHAMYLGTHIQFTIELLSGAILTVRQPSNMAEHPAINTPVFVSWSPTHSLALAAR